MSDASDLVARAKSWWDTARGREARLYLLLDTLNSDLFKLRLRKANAIDGALYGRDLAREDIEAIEQFDLNELREWPCVYKCLQDARNLLKARPRA